MVAPGRHVKEGPHCSKSFATCGRILDYEGFFIAQPDPEPSGNTGGVPHSEVILV